jgi:ABC-2 type transport system permease protein
MHNILTIARRQFRSYFNSPSAYIVVCLLLLLLGVFFWPPFFVMGRASIRDMVQVMPLLLLVAAPAITMGLIAEEKRTGTIELLITMPVKDAEVVLGKYLAALGLWLVVLGATLAYPISVSTLGRLDWGQVSGSYVGLILEGGAMLALGLMASSWTDNQLVGFFVGAALCFAFWIVDRFIPFLPTQIASAVEWLSFDYHYRSMTRGVIDSRDVLYFLSVIGLSLGLAFRSLERRRWQ